MRQDPDTHPSSDAAPFDRAVYDGLANALGAGPVGGMARRFRSDLRQRFGDRSVRDALRRDAHAVTSAAGMLGLAELSQTAKALERACAADADLTAPLAALLAARDAADRCLAEVAPGDG